MGSTRTGRRFAQVPLLLEMTAILVVAEAPWVRNDVLSAADDTWREIVVIDDPRQAIEQAGGCDEEAVAVVDMQVGSMGGMAICRAIREARRLGSLPSVPVVLLLDRQADAFLARRAGAAGWLLKPFSPHQLRSAVSEAAGAGSSPVEVQPES